LYLQHRRAKHLKEKNIFELFFFCLSAVCKQSFKANNALQLLDLLTQNYNNSPCGEKHDQKCLFFSFEKQIRQKFQ
jgi:hypothetical protein